MHRRAIFLTTIAGGVSTYTISGTVYDSDGTTAVSGATVALGALSATSAANGTYTISNVPAGTSGSMTCTKTGYSWTAITVAAMSGNLTSQNYTNAWWAAGGCAASCVAAYKAIGAASLAASYVNLANPGTNDAAPGTAPTFDAATGWTFDGTTTALTTGITPASGYAMFCRYSNITNTKTLVGEYTDGARFELAPQTGAGVTYCNGNFVQVLPSLTSGNVGVSGTRGYRNGTAEGAAIGTWTASATSAILIGDRGGAADKIAGKIQALVIYNAGLTAPQITALVAAMAALTNP